MLFIVLVTFFSFKNKIMNVLLKEDDRPLGKELYIPTNPSDSSYINNFPRRGIVDTVNPYMGTLSIDGSRYSIQQLIKAGSYFIINNPEIDIWE